MNLFALVASFGGGIIGAYMGALPAFILTGVIAIAGAVAAMAGGADMTVGFIAFGSYLGPHIAFAGGVAASAYAGKTKKLGSGTDILSIGSYPVLCFGIAAVSLIFAQTGFAMPATHHIALISALAAVTAQNPVMGIVFGILTSLFGDFIGKTFNSCCDTHIDPPAFTIFIFTFIVNVLFGSGFFSV